MSAHNDWIVYIVDDDDSVRDSTQELLQCIGFNVEGFSSGRDFLQKFDAAAGLCIILDLYMPDISGLQVLDALQARRNTVPVILFSGLSDHMTEEAARRFGVIARLGKSTHPDIMIDLIQTLASEKSTS